MCLTIKHNRLSPPAMWLVRILGNSRYDSLKRKIMYRMATLGSMVASEDMTVYKILFFRGHDDAALFSPHRHEQYEIGSMKKSKFTFQFDHDALDVNQGLHSWESFEQAKVVFDKMYARSMMYPWYYMGSLLIFKATVPKGARYFYGMNNDIVSNSLVVQDGWKYEGAGTQETHQNQ